MLMSDLINCFTMILKGLPRFQKPPGQSVFASRFANMLFEFSGKG